MRLASNLPARVYVTIHPPALSLLLVLCTALPAGAQISLYVGGNASVSFARITTDAQGNTYAIGTQLVTSGSYTSHSVFVTKVDAGGAIVFSTRFGGKGDDIATGLGVDSAGRVYGAGYTTSPDFPLLHAIQTSPSVAGPTGFVFSLDPTGQLVWSTYFGGVAREPNHGGAGSLINAISTDANGNSFIAGTSRNGDLPINPGAFQKTSDFSTVTAQISNGFVAKLSASGQLVYSTWLSGSLIDCKAQACQHTGPRIDSPTAIAIDGSGAAYITGYTDSSDFPTTPGAYQTKICCTSTFQSYDAFLSKLSPDGTALVYSTFLGTLGFSQNPPASSLNHGLAVDATGAAYVGFGTTGNFTVDLGGNPTSLIGPNRIQVLALNPAGSAVNFSALLPGTADQFVTGLAVDSQRNIYLSGHDDLNDFLRELDPTGNTTLNSATYPIGAAGQDLALSPAGSLIAAGSSGRILRLPSLAPTSQPMLTGGGNAATGTVDSAFNPGEIISIYGSGLGPASPVTAVPTPNPIAGSLTSASFPEALGGVKVAFNGQPGALFYVSGTQINVAVPGAISSPVLVTINNNGAVIGPIPLGAAAAIPTPGIFRVSGGAGAILNQDGTLNGPSNPARSNTAITLFGTGVPALAFLSSDGGAIPSSVPDLSGGNFVGLSLQSFGPSLQVLYAGGAPGLVGDVFQVNARLPASLPNAFLALTLTASGAAAPVVGVYVAP